MARYGGLLTDAQFTEGFEIASSPNTVHLTILIHFENSICTLQQAPRGRRGKLLILRLTPRGRR